MNEVSKGVHGGIVLMVKYVDLFSRWEVVAPFWWTLRCGQQETTWGFQRGVVPAWGVIRIQLMVVGELIIRDSKSWLRITRRIRLVMLR